MRFPFQFTEYLFPGLCQPRLLLFCATLTFGFLDSLSSGSGSTRRVTERRLAASPDLLALRSPNLLKQRRYSSEREREMRGPFLISFLFSSFLLLFSSSLRIFLNASAVWSTCGGDGVVWQTARFKLQDRYATHVVSLCAVWIHKVWSFLCYSQLLRHLNTQSGEKKKKKKFKTIILKNEMKLRRLSFRHQEWESIDIQSTRMHSITSPTAATNLRMNPLCDSRRACLKSQINHVTVWFINPQTGRGKPVYRLCSWEVAKVTMNRGQSWRQTTQFAAPMAENADARLQDSRSH